jgi:hypothetical protein
MALTAMAASKNPRKPQVALRKGATETGIIAELISLLETVTADGTITESEAAELRVWLDENRDSELPAIDFLRTTLEQVLADGRVTPEERRALHMAVERVLPLELRERAKGRRAAQELLAKAREREERAASRQRAAEEREKNRSVFSANFMVAGVAYEGRSKVVDRHLRTGQTVFLARDPGNPHDGKAIEVRVAEGYQVGFVPRDDASQMAPLLDAGHKQVARCTKILNGRRAPIPVVQANLYRPDATIEGAISVPPRSILPTPPTSGPSSDVPATPASGSGCASNLAVALLFAFLIALSAC